MVIYLFEDNSDTPSSCLLKKCFNGKNIYFSDGCSRLWKYAKSLIRVGNWDKFFIFYDLPLDNSQAQAGYLRLMSNYDNYDHPRKSDIYIIPVICIEYFIVLMLNHYNYFDLQLASTGDTLEQRYKSTLSEFKEFTCIHNRRKYGEFYHCTCNSCGKCKDDVLKAEQLYTCLPVADIVSKKHLAFLRSNNIFMKPLDIPTLEKNIVSFYEALAKDMGLSNIVGGLQSS